jgi:hypothetical protein
MRKVWPLLLLVIPLHSIHSQEVKHAPTVEQCRADLRLRMSKVLPVHSRGVDDVMFVELIDWDHELYQCRTVDVNLMYQYANVGGAVAQEQKLRLLDFVKRHDLLGQFLAEDAPGKR